MPERKGKLLRVDLSSGRIAVEGTRSDWRRDYVGGRGLAARYLYEEIDARVQLKSKILFLLYAILAGSFSGKWAT